jgi:butyrate kinase
MLDTILELAIDAAAEIAEAAITKKFEKKKEGNKAMSIKSLIINPGSTSTKIGVFEDETLLFEETLRHSTEEIARYATIVDQKDFRKDIIVSLLKEKNFDLHSLNVVVGRGGMLKPIVSGTYAVSDALLEDLKIGVQGQHASNLGGILAREIGDSIGVPSYIVDPVVVDELMPSARFSGVPELPRVSIFHALNQKAVAKRYAKEAGKPYESLRLIVVHMGGGVSVGAHIDGRVVDVFNALDGDGAFSPERAGAVPSGALVKMCFSGKYTEKEVYKKLVGNGGFNAYLGTNDMRNVEKMVDEGNEDAIALREAFILQVVKDIGSMACVLEGKIDRIIVTGGIAYDKYVVAELEKRAGFIAPFTIYPGEDELLALAQGALRVMNGEEKAMEY